jgi:hypothetical protein
MRERGSDPEGNGSSQREERRNEPKYQWTCHKYAAVTFLGQGIHEFQGKSEQQNHSKFSMKSMK